MVKNMGHGAPARINSILIHFLKAHCDRSKHPETAGLPLHKGYQVAFDVIAAC